MIPGETSLATRQMERLSRAELARRQNAVLKFLRTHGLLLQADAELASIATIVAGEPIRGSWWSHPRADDIYDVCVALEDEPDIIELKLVKGKVTHVQQSLWPAVYAVATADEPWQRKGLTAVARSLEKIVDSEGAVRSDEYRSRLREPKRLGPAIRLLEQRMLVVTTEVHTERGAHAKVLQTFQGWAEGNKLRGPMDLSEAKARLLEAVRTLGADLPARYVAFE